MPQGITLTYLKQIFDDDEVWVDIAGQKPLICVSCTDEGVIIDVWSSQYANNPFTSFGATYTELSEVDEDEAESYNS